MAPIPAWQGHVVYARGSLVRHGRDTFRAEAGANCAEPGNAGHARLYVSHTLTVCVSFLLCIGACAPAGFFNIKFSHLSMFFSTSHYLLFYRIVIFIIMTIILIIIIIIYRDFLPTPRRGSHVKSGKTHTQSSRYTP